MAGEGEEGEGVTAPGGGGGGGWRGVCGGVEGRGGIVTGSSRG